jgi:hypothetical protein
MLTLRRRGVPPRLDERGVALPLALLGLVVVSLLVTTAMLSSSTEMATSQASTDATRNLYRAESAVDAYLVGISDGQTRLDREPSPQRFAPAGGDSVQFTITRLSRYDIAADSTMQVFSVLSEPLRNGQPRGRSVIAMVQQILEPPRKLGTNVNSAIAMGGNLDVNGNAFTVSGRLQNSDTCAASGVDAVHNTSGSEITANNEGHMKNFIGVDSTGKNSSGWDAIRTITGKTREELAYEALGLNPGETLDDLIDQLPPSKKFGPRFGSATSTFDGRVDASDKVAVIDANGGFVELVGDSGVVIIVNGHLRMRGNSQFKGIIIVEGNFDLAGTPTVNGALISLGIQETSAGNIINLTTEAELSGHVTVQFNRCSILSAENAFRNVSEEFRTPTTMPPFAWFEVVR